MKLIKQLCIGLCSLAIVSHAAPLLENNHLKIKDGAVELDRQGDVVFSDDFSKGLENWEVSNFENKLVMDARTVFGEKAAYIGMINSVWYNGSGAHQDTLTTCSDLVRMLVEACSYPQILKVWNKKSYTIPVGGTNPRSVSLTTTVSNLTLEAYYTILGGKTGSLGSYEALVMVAKIK